MTKLTKNFNYIERVEFKIDKKEKIISLLEKIERMQDPNSDIRCINDVLLFLLQSFISNNKMMNSDEQIQNAKLPELIKVIEDSGKVIDSKYCFNIMHQIRKDRNFICHENEDDFSNYNFSFDQVDVCQKLKNLFYIIKVLFNDYLNEKERQAKFDTKPYNQNVNIEINNEISAISQARRESDVEPFDNIRQELKIDKDPIKSWLSIEKAKLMIPIYQRNYQWKEKNVDVLIDDIDKRMNDGETHYFGTIAQKKKTSLNINDPDLIKIIDGQQRLTTSFLIVCAARDILREDYSRNQIDWYEEITNKHFSKTLSDYFHNPGGKNVDNNAFEKIMNGKKIEENRELSKTRFYQNYDHIKRKLQKKFDSPSQINNFVTTFLNKFQVATINFDFNKVKNKREMEVFENLNSKGLELSTSDLIKNHLFNYCSDELLNNKEIEIPQEYNKIKTDASLDKCDKNGDCQTLDNFYVNISEIIKGEELPKDKRERFILIKESIDELLDEFKNEITDFKDYERMMSTLRNYMYLYSEIQFETSFRFIKFIQCEQIINIINEKKKKIFFTYFMYIIFDIIQAKYDNKYDFLNLTQQFNLQKEEIKKIQELFLEIVKYICRTQVITKQGDSNIKRILIGIANKYWKEVKSSIPELCKNIIYDIKKIYDEAYEFDKFKNALKTNNNYNQVASLLRLTEVIMSDSLCGGEIVQREKPSIEHIMPRNLDEWVKNQDMTKEEIEEYKNKANEYQEKIGNYLILSKSYNSKNSNNTFLIKKQKVFKQLVSPLYSNEDPRIDVSKRTKWDFEDIDERTDALIEYILKHVITK